jgi:hypothetical protein
MRNTTVSRWTDGEDDMRAAIDSADLAFRGVGAKFEELLVITDDDAYWLDDDLPDVRRSATHQGATA